GRAIMAVREDEIAAATAGIDPTRQKVTAFIVGAFFGGVAGAMFSLHERSITPSYFGLAKSIEIVVMVTLGGLGSISGAILAAIVLTLLPEVLRPIAEYRMIIYSLLLVFMMLLRPQGLLGGIELWPGRRGRLRNPVATDGKVEMGGRRIDGLSPVQINRTGIARTFQNIRLFENLTVLDNVIVGFNRSAEHGLLGTILRTPKFARERAQADADGLELLRTLRLDGKADYVAKNLPYGDQPRLEIARALA